VLGVVTAAVAYVSGIAASRRLGPRLASFVGLLEVLAGLLFAWALLGQLPGWVQVLGGLLVLTGVVVVRAGESAILPSEPASVVELVGPVPVHAAEEPRPTTGVGAGPTARPGA
jgi:hypothetical protein